MMSKKDYIKFAEMIAEHKAMYKRNEIPQIGLNNSYELVTIDLLQNDMINLFQSDNPLFDAERFNDYIDKRVNELSHQ